MKKIKLLSLLMAATLMFSAVAGCDSKTTKETTSTPGGSKLAPVELTWYMIGTPQDNMQPVLDEVNKITKEKINATVKINIIDWGSYEDKIRVLQTSGAPMDLVFTSNWSNNYAQNAAKNAFVPLDDLLQKYGKEYFEAVPKKYWDSVKVNGKIYGAINYQLEYFQSAVFLKKDMVEKYKFDVSKVKSIKDLEPMFETIKKNEPNMYPVLAVNNACMGVPYDNLDMGWKYDDMKGSVEPFGVDMKAKDYKALNLYSTPEFLDFYKVVRGWYEKGYIPKDAASKKDARAEAQTGKYFAVGDSYKPGGEIDEKNRVGYDVVPVILNAPEGGSAIGTMTAISKSSKNPERAMMFLNLLNTDKKLYNLLCHGIENKHYKKVDDVTIETIDKSGYAPGLDWEFGNQFNSYFLKGQANTIWTDTIKANESAEMGLLTGFNFNSDSVKNEVAQITNILSTYKPGLITGSVDPEKTLTEMNSKIKAAGGDKVLAELQKQIDEWRKANGK